MAGMRANACKADFSLLLGDLLGFDQVVADFAGLGLGVEVPDVDVIGAQFPQAGVQVLQRAILIICRRFGGEHNLVALPFQGCADHLFVVAVLVDASSVEISDAEVGGAGNHAGVRGDHAAEAQGGNLEAGFAQGAVVELHGGIGGGGGGLRPKWSEFTGEGGQWQSQAGRQKTAP